MTEFEQEVSARLEAVPANQALQAAAAGFLKESIAARYSYNFFWMGRPIIQYPQDMAAMQEIVWQVRPDVIVETGIAHGGSLVLSASLLALLDLCDATETGEMLDPSKPKRRVVGIDIDIRAHNRAAIEAHPMANRITMIEGSSIDAAIVAQVSAAVGDAKRVLVCLDSNHTHDHVLAELQAYAPMVTPGSYCIVFDTVVEDLPKELSFDRPWGPGANPKTAIHAWLPTQTEFQIDRSWDAKLVVSVAPDGFLKRR
ncbi:cephalosporin hydroxylase [bacterium]|nr:cephalosporin hydroxylase [bacterium]